MEEIKETCSTQSGINIVLSEVLDTFNKTTGRYIAYKVVECDEQPNEDSVDFDIIYETFDNSDDVEKYRKDGFSVHDKLESIVKFWAIKKIDKESVEDNFLLTTLVGYFEGSIADICESLIGYHNTIIIEPIKEEENVLMHGRLPRKTDGLNELNIRIACSHLAYLGLDSILFLKLFRNIKNVECTGSFGKDYVYYNINLKKLKKD